MEGKAYDQSEGKVEVTIQYELRRGQRGCLLSDGFRHRAAWRQRKYQINNNIVEWVVSFSRYTWRRGITIAKLNQNEYVEYNKNKMKLIMNSGVAEKQAILIFTWL